MTNADDGYYSDDAKRKRRETRIKSYGIGIGLFVCLSIFLYADAQPAGLIVMKLCTVPSYLMAASFIRLQFSSKQARTPWTVPFLERFALVGLIFGCMMATMLWTPGTPYLVTLANLLIASVLFGALMASFEAWQKGAA